VREGFGSGAGSGSRSIPLTNGSRSGSRRPKNMWIRIRIRIRIRNTGTGTVWSLTSDRKNLEVSVLVLQSKKLIYYRYLFFNGHKNGKRGYNLPDPSLLVRNIHVSGSSTLTWLFVDVAPYTVYDHGRPRLYVRDTWWVVSSPPGRRVTDTSLWRRWGSPLSLHGCLLV
jgi:hypothetical protein